jgi:hypothetical protein
VTARPHPEPAGQPPAALGFQVDRGSRTRTRYPRRTLPGVARQPQRRLAPRPYQRGPRCSRDARTPGRTRTLPRKRQPPDIPKHCPFRAGTPDRPTAPGTPSRAGPSVGRPREAPAQANIEARFPPANHETDLLQKSPRRTHRSARLSARPTRPAATDAAEAEIRKALDSALPFKARSVGYSTCNAHRKTLSAHHADDPTGTRARSDSLFFLDPRVLLAPLFRQARTRPSYQ